MSSSLLYTNTASNNNFTTFPTSSSSAHNAFNYTIATSPNTMEKFAPNDEQDFVCDYLLRTSFHSIFLKFGRLIKENLHDENSLISELQVILGLCSVNTAEFVRLFNMLLNFYQNYNQYLNQNGNDGKFSIKILIVYLLHKFVKNLDTNRTIMDVLHNRLAALDAFVLNFIKISEEELKWQNNAVLQRFKSLLYQNFQVI